MKDTASHVALLAPVPLVHLLDGKEVAEREGRVAFGSRAWELFRELDALRKGLAVDVYVYASHAEAPPLAEASWHARYVGHVESSNGAHPSGMRYRPPSTGVNPADNLGHWAVFWEVEALQQLPSGRRIRLSDLTGFGKKKAYGPTFVPEGPLLIEHP
jgi:hypothetical protein